MQAIHRIDEACSQAGTSPPLTLLWSASGASDFLVLLWLRELLPSDTVRTASATGSSVELVSNPAQPKATQLFRILPSVQTIPL
jgi:hypothetical protein